MTADVLQKQPEWLDGHHPREGRYVLGPLLGQGGMGEVREAWDVVLCRTVALKVLKQMDPVSLIRFMHEAQIHGRVIHPNICRIYDVDGSQGAPRIAMQLVRGPTLAEAASDLTLDEIVTILAQVAEAVHAAHRIKLIHRDLKPSNILLERDPDGRWIPYVCDFGLAMAMDEPALTYSHAINGTPAYMAPEQIRGERDRVGPPTDVYALGGTLYYALYNLVPRGFPLGDEPSLAKRNQPVPLPACPRQGMRPELVTILQKCLEPDPSLRYQSAAALADDLWRFRDGEPIHAQPRGPLDRWVRLWRRNRRVSMVTTVAAGLLLGALILGQSLRSQAAARRAEWTRAFALEAAELDKELLAERMLPAHDLRPAYLRLKNRIESIRTRMDTLGADATAPGGYLLARAHYLLGDFPEAQADLERTWAAGYRGPEVAYLLARTLAGNSYRRENAARYASGLPTPNQADTAQRVESLFLVGRGMRQEPDDLATALVAFVQRDFDKAAATAHNSAQNRPWQPEGAWLEAVSLCALARQKYDGGDLDGAEGHYREAMDTAQHALAQLPSDEFLHHAYLLGARGLAFLQWERGRLALDTLAEYQRFAQQALKVNPDRPELQDDWILLDLLKAMRQVDLGQDPESALESALVFVGTRAKEPLPVELKADRMLIYWRLAERSFGRGDDPGPALEEALKNAGHTTFLHRDYLGEVLNFKARLEAARGADPRPTLKDTLARLQPQLDATPSWSLCETAAETWLLQAEWEAGHGQNAAASLAKAQELTERALRGNSNSANAYALKGLERLLQARIAPADHAIQLLMAQERLKAAETLAPAGRLQAQLRQALARNP